MMPEIDNTTEAKLQSPATEKSGGQESIADAVPIPGSVAIPETSNLTTAGNAQHVAASPELDAMRPTTARFPQLTIPQAEAVSHTTTKASVAIELYDVISDSGDELSTNAQFHLVDKTSYQVGMKHNPIRKTGQQNKGVTSQTAGITKIADGPAKRLPRNRLPLVNQTEVGPLATPSGRRNEPFDSANLNVVADGSIHPDIAQPEPSITGFNDKKPNAKADAQHYGRKRTETGKAGSAGNRALADYRVALDKLKQIDKCYADARSSADENVPSRKSKMPRKSETQTTDTINQGNPATKIANGLSVTNRALPNLVRQHHQERAIHLEMVGGQARIFSKAHDNSHAVSSVPVVYQHPLGIIDLGERSAEIAVEGNSNRQRPAFTNAKKRSATEDLIRDTIAELHYISDSDNDNTKRKYNSPMLTKNPTERSNGRKLPSRAMNLQPQRRIAPSTPKTVTYPVRPLETAQKSVSATKQSGHIVSNLAPEHLHTYHDPQIGNRTLGGISHHDSPGIGSQSSGMNETRNKPGVSERTESFKNGVLWPLGPALPTPVVYYVDIAVHATDYQGIHKTEQGFRIDIRPGADHYEYFNSMPITLPTVNHTPNSSINFTCALNAPIPGLRKLRSARGALHIALLPVFSEFCELGRCI
ncbi:hypothetical protein NQ176_g1284 [Zarea fungicola]|uniref:Uncharacterized protein n=1 Tax=Zarea fungicola TaxID=93591 RepID=A0ACC1NTE0_9HYPO|nr:hypothetical protein NQ176_g1284 [Lecanicillium fungicola]